MPRAKSNFVLVVFGIARKSRSNMKSSPLWFCTEVSSDTAILMKVNVLMHVFGNENCGHKKSILSNDMNQLAFIHGKVQYKR